MPPYKKLPRARNGRPRAFSLVLSLTVMAMLLLLCIGAAALLTVQLRVSRATISYAKARLNAMAGARIALGELQRLVGPDQRVTATADILCNPTQSDPTQDAYYLNEDQKTSVVHPRWVGVWNSGRVADRSVDAVDTARGEQTRVVQRTDAGYLMDSRYVGGRENWLKRRGAVTLPDSSPRLAGWLVSGNEALAHTERDALTPFSPLAEERPGDPLGRGGDTILLGRGALSSGGRALPSPANKPLGDYLGVRVPRVLIPEAGSYAYWVADEGVKARINLRDKFADAGKVPNASTPGDGGFARLLVPQRFRFDIAPSLANPVPGAPAMPAMPDGEGGVAWDKAESFEDISLAGVGVETAGLRPYYLHDITFTSAGVACDVVNGGLKKDLTAYVNTSLNAGGRGAPSIADYAGVTGSGLSGKDSIITEPTLSGISPKFGLIQSWGSAAPSYNTTGVASVGPTTFGQNYNYSTREMQGGLGGSDVPNPLVVPPAGTLDNFTLQLPKFSEQTQAPLSPVISSFSVNFNPIIEDRGPFRDANEIRMLVYPTITLWNPYAVPVRLDQGKLDYLSNRSIRGYVWAGRYGFCRHSRRSRINFKLPVNIVLKPGQSKVFVSDRSAPTMIHGLVDAGSVNSNASLTGSQIQCSISVQMIEGLPSSANYFIDSINSVGGSSVYFNATVSSPLTVENTPNPLSSLTLYGAVMGTFADYNEKRLAQEQVILSDGVRGLQQVNMDSFLSKIVMESPDDFLNTSSDSMNYKYKDATIDFSLSRWSRGLPKANEEWSLGFRLKRLDSTETQGGQLTGRSLNFSPMVDANVRSARQSRYPFDSMDLNAAPAVAHGGVWTSDSTSSIPLNPILAPDSPDKYVPFYQPLVESSTYPGCIPYDVPYSEIGLLSLGQLRHAPLNILPYGPSMPFGNGRIPVAAKANDATAGLMTDRTGVGSAELEALWKPLAQGWGHANFNETLRQIGGAALLSSETHDIFDIAYEQNHALWDSFRFSGIARENQGWLVTKSDSRWENEPPTGADLKKTLPNSRYWNVPTSGTSPYFSDTNYNLYRAGFSLLEKGAFNVNSTSKVAWLALLSSFRGIKVPTTDGGQQSVTASETPFLRSLRPKSGKAVLGSFDEATWSGYRVLSDDELVLLAGKIVSEVKKRGPFMSLADFVNRPLVKPNDYSNWDQAEFDYLGTLEAAIAASNLNQRFDDSRMDREAPDLASAKGASTPRKPQFRSRHKIAGAPGYLEQGDILQQIGSALTARSDTFTVRAMGESNGAVAYVELTVQRFPEPMKTGVNDLPVNPLSIQANVNPAYAGNQFFGRRMKIVSTRWVAPEEI